MKRIIIYNLLFIIVEEVFVFHFTDENKNLNNIDYNNDNKYIICTILFNLIKLFKQDKYV